MEYFCREFSSFLYKYEAAMKWTDHNFTKALQSESIDVKTKNKMVKQLCREMVTDKIAKVTVFYEKKKYVKTYTNKRVTIADQLGQLGKILKPVIVFRFVDKMLPISS